MSAESIDVSPVLNIRQSIVLKAIASGVPEAEAIKLGGWGNWAQTHPGQWLKDHPAVAANIAHLRETILFDAAESLHELIRGYAGLLIQEARLESMLGHDIMDLYHINGSLMRVEMWPEAWRKQLVTEIETLEQNVRSHDGKTDDKGGGWDVVGRVKKIKRERALDIERTLMQCKREQREQLELIMKHKAVDAMVQQKAGNTEVHLHEHNERIVQLATVCTPEQLQQLRDKALESEK